MQGAVGFKPSAGFIVGATEGGTFGKHHFDEFYKILKLKEFIDREQPGVDNPSISASRTMVRSIKATLTGVALAASSAFMRNPAGVTAGINMNGGGASSTTTARGAAIGAAVLHKNEN